ncbi:MAG: hypothetical protein SFY80_09900 [Verrucomicrobiota bacterium]|nr:hypothetical protein [Verrucomicrobiota bacterium]
MDEQTPDTSADQPLQSLDLSALAGLSLGPKWGTGDSQAKRYAEYEEGGDRGGRNRSGGGGGQRRDRRPSFDRPPGGGDRPQGAGDRPQGFRPAGGPGGDRGPRPPRSDGPSGPPRAQPGNAPRGNFGGDRGPSGQQGGPGGGGERRGPQRFERRDRWEERPQFYPTVEVSFYPEDAPFKVLTQAIKSSCRTFELFEIARLILQKPERFVVVIKPLPRQDGAASQLYISGPDSLPFETEAEAIDHCFANLLDSFFTIETVDVEAPKGSYTVINKCTITGELLGPPNYHRYQSLCQQHHSAKLSNMSYDRFMSKVESVRDPEVVQQWLQKMTKQTRYTVKAPPAGSEAQTFDNRDSARFYLITHCKEQLARATPTARFDGKMIDKLPQNSLIRQSVEFALDQQRHFPLDTANHLRGRLRRMNYSVYKKGSKGISYVCAVKRRFRSPGQVFGDSVQQLIDFIEHHPNMLASELPKQYLGIIQDIPVTTQQSATAPAPEATPVVEGTESTPAATEPVADGQPIPAAVSLEDQLRLRQLRVDLRWLVTEGYVIEYSNARLFAPPPQANPPSDRDEDDSEPVGGEAAHAEHSANEASTEPATTPVVPGPVVVQPETAVDSAPADALPAAGVVETEIPATPIEPPANESPKTE